MRALALVLAAGCMHGSNGCCMIAPRRRRARGGMLDASMLA
jgi:hypothetical protein